MSSPILRGPIPATRLAASASLIAAALLAATSSLVLAQTNPAPTQLPPVVVTAPTGSLTVPGVDDARRIIETTPGGVEIVPAEQYRDGRANTVKDVLDFVPGVFAQPKYGQEDSRLAIRGSGLSRSFHLRGIRLLQDGVPLNQADGGGDFQEIDPLAFRYVEVYKGANALQFGAATLGGAVNFVSPTGRGEPGFLVRQELGSFDTWRSQFAAGGVVDGFDYYLTPTYSHSSGFRDHTDQDYARFNGNIGYQFNEGGETRVFLSANNINQKIVSAVTKSQAINQPSTAWPQNFTSNTKRDIDSFRLSSKTTVVTDIGDVTFGAYYADKSLFHPVLFNPSFGIVIDNEENNYGTYAKLAQTGTIAGRKNEFVVGFNYIGGVNHARQYQNVGGARGNLINDVDERSDNVEVYGENSFYVLPTVALIAGLQVNFSQRELVDNFLSNGNDSGTRVYNSVNPKLGALWDVAPQAQVFGNLSWSSEPPAFSELNPSSTPGFANLKQQKATTLETGVRGRRADIAWDVAVYRAWLRDELQIVDIGGGTTQAANISRTIHQGVEAGSEWTFLHDALATKDRAALRLAYTFSDFRFDDDPVYGDNQLPGAPRHYLRAELRYTHDAGWYVGPNVEWVPQSYYVDNANTTKTDPYALLGLKAGYDFGNGLKLFLDGRNLLDKSYISNVNTTTTASTSSALFYPGDGRAVFAGVEMRW